MLQIFLYQKVLRNLLLQWMNIKLSQMIYKELRFHENV